MRTKDTYPIGTILKVSVGRLIITGTVAEAKLNVGSLVIDVHDDSEYKPQHDNYRMYKQHNFSLSNIKEVVYRPIKDHFDEGLFEL